MQLRSEHLSAHLEQASLAPIYLLSGDEPLQITEAADAIRQAARTQGFADRQVFDAQPGFDWNRLIAEADALSLFSERRLFDLRIPGGKPGNQGGQALLDYVARLPGDTLLLLTLPKLERTQRSSKWFKAIDEVGVVVSVWPVETSALPGWLKFRARSAGLDLEPDALAFLAAQTEGNLLAAAQEIDKLLLLHGPGAISLEQTAASVGGSARYSVFNLVDSALRGASDHSLRMLHGLRGEGTPAPVVLWSLIRELRVLEAVAVALESRVNPGSALAAHHVWDKRKGLVTQAARRLQATGWRRLVSLCALADRAIKGRSVRDPWQLLEDIVTGLAGAGGATPALAGDD